jgi:hypothetical protein
MVSLGSPVTGHSVKSDFSDSTTRRCFIARSRATGNPGGVRGAAWTAFLLALRKSLNDSIDLKAKRVSSNPAPTPDNFARQKPNFGLSIVFA